MFTKVISHSKEAREKFLKGVEAVDAIIGSTIGPGGSNIITAVKYKAPNISNDGANNARRIVLQDEIADLAAQTAIDVSMRTADQAGDGTTTSIVIFAEIYRTCHKLLSENKSIFEGGKRVVPMTLRRQIQAECEKAVALLKESSKDLKDKDLDHIISTSLENLEYGKTLADLIRTVGVDGYISVEDNWATQYGISTETTLGMRFLGTYASPYLATEKNAKEAIWDSTYVLVTNHRIETPEVLRDLIDDFNVKGIRKLVIIGGYSSGENPFSPQFIQSVAGGVLAAAKGNANAIQILAIKASSLTTPELQDVAEFCGGTFIDSQLGMNLNDVRLESLGFVKKASVDETEVNLMGGKGSVEERIKTLKEQIKTEKDPMFKAKLERRVASLASGQGVIRVGALTESDRTYLKEKIVDAVNAGRAAMEEGYVKGGGQALKEIAEKLGKKSILYSALQAPYKRICENAGEDLKIPTSVIDPTKVVRLALENACSGAGTLITANVGIAEKKMEYIDYLEKAMKKVMVRDNDDWRDDENQDLGRSNIV